TRCYRDWSSDVCSSDLVVTFRGRHYGTNAQGVSSPTYSSFEFTYSAGAPAIGAPGLVSLAKTQRRLRAIAFGLEHARKIVGDPRPQVGVIHGQRDLESPLEVAVRRVAPAGHVGNPSRHAVNRDGCQRVARAGGQVDRLLDEFARALHLTRLESGLSHPGDQVRP